MLNIILCVVFCIASGILCGYLYDRISGYSFGKAYDRAQMEDLKYFREHPDCTLAKAHQHRDKVLKKYNRY